MLGPGSQVWAECEQSVLLSDFLPADGRVRKEEELSNVLHTDNSWSTTTSNIWPATLTDLLQLSEGVPSPPSPSLTSRNVHTQHNTLNDIVNWTERLSKEEAAGNTPRLRRADIRNLLWWRSNQSSWNLDHICHFYWYQGRGAISSKALTVHSDHSEQVLMICYFTVGTWS